ncbi:lymphokine-activated killer T-cell-originated protein kinase homolog [Pseudochaenichthys georgianus]|uniref:lymphokine-activated killer T-cell-originated protein kinase homolog n=1 Tax=Pseudochaenichthys georgianus TaxID=52239 RepID=UPI00146C9BF1|nr:lymphokine-activated killer T-cell-originated protein kinase homolog [Pseudochaenichthys georgianus]XP_033931995.1 lymphokine-activated killer T-cell-originated protein kinase homolog [Pseudochaenichthys georgianus]
MASTFINESAMKTPTNVRVKKFVNGGTPITIPASPFMKKLGCGTGVNVYLMDRMGKLNASPWAVKKINTKCASNQMAVYQKRLSEEAKVLKEINHPNIVGFRAFTEANDGSKCLAMEYGGEQSLNDLIEKRKVDGLKAFPAANIEKVALHVARGLQYLHNEKKLLHGDMKSCNVVIKGDFETVKICDVGVSLQLDENMRVSDPKAEYIGTEPWTPKEALEDGEITDKADIFAYGLTLWEMMSLAMPHLEMLEGEDDEKEVDEEEDEDKSMEVSFDEDAYYDRLGTRPAVDLEALGSSYRRMVELFYLCTEENPKKRPSAARILQALESNGPLNNTPSEVIVID